MNAQSILFVYFCLQFGNYMTVNGQNSCTATVSGYWVKHCPDGWVRYRQEKCFNLISTSGVTWFSANQTCERHESKLASVHSKEELEFLNTYFDMTHFPEVESFNTWIGGFKRGEKWMWADYTAFDYTDWLISFPKMNGSEKCLVLATHSFHLDDKDNYGKMYHGSCYQTAANFICQKYQVDVRKIVYTK